ncbi:hypothetical protein MRB53_039927 [Persea americana]|nr:hypothetical protein MRB53_039927 [Persea americana]
MKAGLIDAVIETIDFPPTMVGGLVMQVLFLVKVMLERHSVRHAIPRSEVVVEYRKRSNCVDDVEARHETSLPKRPPIRFRFCSFDEVRSSYMRLENDSVNHQRSAVSKLPDTSLTRIRANGSEVMKS